MELADVNLPTPLTKVILRCFTNPSQTVIQGFGDACFQLRTFVEVNFRFAETDAVFAEFFRFMDDLRHMQQGF